MVPPKGLLFFIFSIPFFFLIVNKTKSSSDTDTDTDRDTDKTPIQHIKKETKESSTQTPLSEYDIIIEESKLKTQEDSIIVQSIVPDIDSRPSTEESATKMPETHSSKRILDYFAYFVSGKCIK